FVEPVASCDRKQVLPVAPLGTGSTQLRQPSLSLSFATCPNSRPMKDRYNTLKAVALVLRRMDRISEELGKPGTQLVCLQYEWKNLETKYQELMDRLADLP